MDRYQKWLEKPYREREEETETEPEAEYDSDEEAEHDQWLEDLRMNDPLRG